MHWLERLDPRPHAAGSVRQRWPWRDARRTLHDHELLLFGRGYHGRIVWDGGHATISGDGWIIIPPGLPHTCDGGGTGSPWRAWIHFDWDASAGADPQQLMTYAPAAAPPQALRPAPAWVAAELPAQGRIDAMPALRNLHGGVMAAWRRGGPAGRTQARALLLQLLAALFDPGFAATDQRSQLAQRVREALDAIATQPFARSDALRTRLAALGHTADTCTRAFRAVFGITPTRYLAVQRMRQAEELLAGGMRAVEVAQRLGFDDPGYFNRVFRRTAGCAPGRYRTSSPTGVMR